jgi:ABC-type multidrug transport system ATPase subunit
MKVLCTLLVPTEGRAHVAGHDVVRDAATVRRLVGYLPQEFGGWRLHTVRELLATLARLSGIRDAGRVARRVESAIDAVGLEEKADVKVKKLSGGMVRRLGVAQALVHDPRVLIVDEPTVGMDPEQRLGFRQLVADLARERIVFLSTHIVSDLGDACRDMALIDRGRVVFRGSPRELVTRARGRVFETVVPAHGEPDLGPDVQVVSARREGVGVRVRAVTGSSAPPSGATPVEAPSLEEAYLVFMAGRGHGVAEIAEDAP